MITGHVRLCVPPSSSVPSLPYLDFMSQLQVPFSSLSPHFTSPRSVFSTPSSVPLRWSLLTAVNNSSGWYPPRRQSQWIDEQIEMNKWKGKNDISGVYFSILSQAVCVCVCALRVCGCVLPCVEFRRVFRRSTSTMQKIGANDGDRWREGNLAAGIVPNQLGPSQRQRGGGQIKTKGKKIKGGEAQRDGGKSD